MNRMNATKIFVLIASLGNASLYAASYCGGPKSRAEHSNDYSDLASRRARLSAALRSFADTSMSHPGIKIICRPKFVEFWISGMQKIVVAHTPLQSFGELRSQEELKTYFELIAACSMLQEESWEEVTRNDDGTISTRRLT